MTDKGEKESKLIRMQKLRRAVGRLQNIRSSGDSLPVQKQSWLTRLKERLGLGGAREQSEVL